MFPNLLLCDHRAINKKAAVITTTTQNNTSGFFQGPLHTGLSAFGVYSISLSSSAAWWANTAHLRKKGKALSKMALPHAVASTHANFRACHNPGTGPQDPESPEEASEDRTKAASEGVFPDSPPVPSLPSVPALSDRRGGAQRGPCWEQWPGAIAVS